MHTSPYVELEHNFALFFFLSRFMLEYTFVWQKPMLDEQRVDYVQVDEKKTQALQNTRTEWTDIRQSKVWRSTVTFCLDVPLCWFNDLWNMIPCLIMTVFMSCPFCSKIETWRTDSLPGQEESHKSNFNINILKGTKSLNPPTWIMKRGRTCKLAGPSL